MKEESFSIFKDSEDLILIADLDGRILRANPASTRITGFTPEEIEGRKIEDFLGDASALRESLENLRLKKSLVESEIKNRRGEKRWISFTIKKSNEDPSRIFIFGHDMTESRKASAKLSLLNELLRKMTLSLTMEEIAESMINMVDGIMEYYFCAILFLDEEKRELYVYKAVGFEEGIKNFRTSLENGKGIALHVAQTMEPYYSSDVSCDIPYLGYAEGVKTEFAVPIKVEDRLYGVLDIESRNEDAFSSSEKEFIEILGSTAALAMEKALLFQKLKLTNEMKEMFISIISHDLKNPLQSIYGYAELLKTRLDDKDRGYVEKMEEAALKMENLIKNVGLYSRLETGSYNEGFEQKDILTILLSAMEGMEHERQKKKVEIQFSPVSCIIPALPITENLFENLLDNAIKCSPQGGRVVVTAEEREDAVIVKIKDNGTGIPPQSKPLLFSRFQRAEQVKGIGGSGLGLGIVGQIIQLHKGRISVEDNQPQGSIFVVELPR